MEWTTFPAQTQKGKGFRCIHIPEKKAKPPEGTEQMSNKSPPAATCLVVQEADGAVLMCSDGDGLRWVTDHTVDQLTACKGRQTTPF